MNAGSPLAALSLVLVLAMLSFSGGAYGATPSISSADAPLPWVERYRQALDIDPDNAALRYQLGLALLSAGENQPAVRELHQAYASLSQTIGINFNLGLAYTRLGDPDSALLYLEQAETAGALEQQEVYPLSSALYNVALLYLDQAQQDEAIEVLRHVVTLAPERRDLLRLYGEILYRAGRTAEAQEQLLRYLELNPDDEQVRESLFALHYNRGLELIDEGAPREAVKAFERARRIAPGSPMALYYLAFLAYQSEDYATVVKHLSPAIASFPDDIMRSSLPLLYNASLRLMQGEQFDAASSGATALLACEAETTRYLVLAGNVALRRQELAAAQEYYSRVIALEPAHAEALQNLVEVEKGLARQKVDEGQKLYRQGELQRAYALFVEANDLNPRDPKVRAYLKDTFEKLSRASDAEFDRAEEARRQGDDILALKHVRSGQQLWKDAPRGTKLEAELLDDLELELARQLLEAQSLLAMKEYSRAAEAFAMLLEINPGYEDARDGLERSRSAFEQQVEEQADEGYRALEGGDLDRAGALFSRVLQQRSDHEGARKGLARIAALREAMIGDELQWARRAASEGDYAAAREHFQNVLRQHDTTPLRDEYLAFESAVEKRLAGLLLAARAAREDHDYRKAIGHYRDAMAVAADSESLSGELEEALLEADETMLSLLVEAREALQRGEAGRCVRLLRDVLRIEPSQPQALEMMQKANKAARQEALALFELGRRHQQAGRLDEARVKFVAALEVDPYLQVARDALDAVDIESRKLSEALVERLYLEGVALYTRGEYNQAILKWRQVLEMQSDHEKTRRNLGKAERKLKQLQERS